VLSVRGLFAAARSSETGRRPNILYIMTDQQHAAMLSCTGNKHVKTPAMDSLAASGTRFELAYCVNPVCLPSRVGMMTGYMPSHFGISDNSDNGDIMPKAALRQSMGRLFRDAGYDTAYGGKTHWPRGMNPQSIGFADLGRDERDGLAENCIRFIRTERQRQNPFLLVASFINPHDICYMSIDDYTRAASKPGMYPGSIRERKELAAAMRLPEGVSREEFFERICPPLPKNCAIPELEPDCIAETYVGKVGFRQHCRSVWGDEQWRLHRWAYRRLTESVDAQIGRVLDALRDAGLEKETLVVFSSDHGDMDAAHRLEHKSVLYEEACRVPFIVSLPGVTRAGGVDTSHLVSSGLDLIPTLCDYAGIKPPAGLPGRSVRSLAEGRNTPNWPDQVVAESQNGRMLRTARYKYAVYETGRRREQLTDLTSDPGEMTNLAYDPKCQDMLQEHRSRLRRWIEQTGDQIGKRYAL
jgi:arylsulfatase A-like enzyme